MLFTDPIFLFYFLPITLLFLRLSTLNNRIHGVFKGGVIFATLVFYSYENWLWVFVFGAVIGGVYVAAAGTGRSQTVTAKRRWVAAGVLHALACLAIFKYLNWLSGYIPHLGEFREWVAVSLGVNGQITLPPGISFYVFEALSFLVDCYRGRVKPAQRALDYFCFITMFPRFIAGPIVRFSDFEEQFRSWTGMRQAPGLTLFGIGFVIKCLLADQAAVFVPYAFDVAHPDFVQSWVGVSAYSIQLYLDFWAYSIMATGLGLCLGFSFPDNFRSPYHASSIGEFWRRWHISLSTWLRDYLYISLGGNRGSKARTYANLMLTMLLGGIWHGASFMFAAWGAFHGLLLVVERLVGEHRLSRIPRGLRQALVLFFVAVGWTMFRSDSFGQMKSVLAGLFGLNGFSDQFNPLLCVKNPFASVLAAGAILFCAFGERFLVSEQPLANREFPVWAQWSVWFLFLLAILVATSSSEIPFLYFKF